MEVAGKNRTAAFCGDPSLGCAVRMWNCPLSSLSKGMKNKLSLSKKINQFWVGSTHWSELAAAEQLVQHKRGENAGRVRRWGIFSSETTLRKVALGWLVLTKLLPWKGIPSARRNFQQFNNRVSKMNHLFKNMYFFLSEAGCFHWPHNQVDLQKNGRTKNYAIEWITD